MTESDSRERISAFLDGEFRESKPDRIVDALYGNPELHRAWVRFHLIGDAMRGVGPVPGADSIAGKVGATLSGEKIVPLKPRLPRPGFGPLAGLALAASVSAVAILGIHSLDDGRDTPSPAVAVAPRPEAVAVGSAGNGPGEEVRRSGYEPTRLQWSDVAPDTEARLNTYLVNHNEFAGNGVRGVMPYVRLVGYQSVAGDDR